MSCECPASGTDRSTDRVYRRVLWAVLAINAAMFIVEGTAGLFAGSVALQADSLDFLGDSANYAISLYVIGRTVRWRAGAALVKGLSMAVFGFWVLGVSVYKTLVLGLPDAATMGSVGTLALLANLAAAVLLFRFRDGDANMRSVWLCTRNDAIGNVAVILAASGVFATGTMWPDLAVGVLLAGLALLAAVSIVRQATAEIMSDKAINGAPAE